MLRGYRSDLGGVGFKPHSRPLDLAVRKGLGLILEVAGVCSCALKGVPLASQLRYMGFDQVKNIREYKFDDVAKDEPTTHFVVSADLALFFRYHVALQEGPALCLKRLSADLEALQRPPHELTASDLTDHVSAQVAAEAERKATRKRRRAVDHL